MLQSKIMGRLKEFELNRALDKAMNLFWQKGYEKTSLKDLLQEMDILNGSFYNTFGSKKELFIKTLYYYDEQVTNKRAKHFEEHLDFKEGIRAFFKLIFKEMARSQGPKGCLISNSLSSELLKDEDIKIYVDNSLLNFKNFFKGEIQKAIDTKQISSSIDAELCSSIIVTYIQGVMKMDCADACVNNLEVQSEHLLDSLGL